VDLNPADVGRPRTAGTAPKDLVELGQAPDGPELTMRLTAIARLLTRPSEAPALVVAAVIHAELLTVRPFVTGNGLVARAVARAIMAARGLDPTGVAVPEVGFLAGVSAAYLGAAAAFAGGTPEGVTLWIEQSANAVELGAREGALVADAVGQTPGTS
jgi:Fic/DOC family